MSDEDRAIGILETVPYAVQPFTGPIAVVDGRFILRSSNRATVDETAELALAKLSTVDKSISHLADSETRSALIHAVSSALDVMLRERRFNFDLFNITRPWGFDCSVARAYGVVVWSVGFGGFKVSTVAQAATEVTLRDFEALRTGEDCAAFTKRWGKLGPRDEPLFFVQETQPDLPPGATLCALRSSGLWPADSPAESQEFRLPLCGEPVDVLLWHSARLRSWRVLLQPLSSRRVLAQVAEEIERFCDVFPDPRARENLVPTLAAPSARTVYQSVSAEEVQARSIQAWSYAFHQEGGEFYFAGPEFAVLRSAMEAVSGPRSAAKLESAVKDLIAKLLRRTLAGHVHLLPKIGWGDREAVSADSLLAWLYLSFAREYAVQLGSVQTYISCIVCGKKVTESSHARNRRKYCSGGCQKLYLRYGPEEARRRVKRM